MTSQYPSPSPGVPAHCAPSRAAWSRMEGKRREISAADDRNSAPIPAGNAGVGIGEADWTIGPAGVHRTPVAGSAVEIRVSESRRSQVRRLECCLDDVSLLLGRFACGGVGVAVRVTRP